MDGPPHGESGRWHDGGAPPGAAPPRSLDRPGPPPHTGYGPPQYPPPTAPGAQGYPPAPPAKGFPIWAIVVIVVAVLAIPAMVAAAVAIPMVATQHDEAKDSAVKEGIHVLQVGIQSYAVDNADVYPAAAEMTPDGAVGQYVDRWPTNPWTGQPMREGSAPGDFHYSVGDDGSGAGGFTLEGYLHDGTPFTITSAW